MTDAPYVIDRHGEVWKVVRDGGMATKADYGGITSIGIQRLAAEHGPLTPFHPQLTMGLLQAAQDVTCPRDTDGDGNCGWRYCPYDRLMRYVASIRAIPTPTSRPGGIDG